MTIPKAPSTLPGIQSVRCGNSLLWLVSHLQSFLSTSEKAPLWEQLQLLHCGFHLLPNKEEHVPHIFELLSLVHSGIQHGLPCSRHQVWMFFAQSASSSVGSSHPMYPAIVPTTLPQNLFPAGGLLVTEPEFPLNGLHFRLCLGHIWLSRNIREPETRAASKCLALLKPLFMVHNRYKGT